MKIKILKMLSMLLIFAVTCIVILNFTTTEVHATGERFFTGIEVSVRSFPTSWLDTHTHNGIKVGLYHNNIRIAYGFTYYGRLSFQVSDINASAEWHVRLPNQIPASDLLVVRILDDAGYTTIGAQGWSESRRFYIGEARELTITQFSGSVRRDDGTVALSTSASFLTCSDTLPEVRDPLHVREPRITIWINTPAGHDTVLPIRNMEIGIYEGNTRITTGTSDISGNVVFTTFVDPNNLYIRIVDGIGYSRDLGEVAFISNRELISLNSLRIGGSVGDLYSLRLSPSNEPITPPIPSAWAVEQVNSAISAGLVPARLQSNYTQAITRAEFASLAVALYEEQRGTITGRSSFADAVGYIDVEKAAYIGVVTGVGDNRFAPNDTLTREQAAVMLSRLANAIGQPLPVQASTFADNASISAWAIEGVGSIQASGIMGGVGDNRFAPQELYTREQSIVTIMRLRDIVK